MRQRFTKSTILILLLLCISSSACRSQDAPTKDKQYAVSISYTPVLNTPDFDSVFGGTDGSTIKEDDQGLIRELEYIALPNTVFEIREVHPRGEYEIYEITTEDYPYTSSPLYIDSRFVKTSVERPKGREKIMPSKDEILRNMQALEGYPYMWGGNYGEGIPALLELYPPKAPILDNTKRNWSLKGVDCSGLIYQATSGNTPRNTSSLVKYGEAVNIEGKSAEEIAEMVEPLDLIVWKGHVIIVLDGNTTIESAPPEGVFKSGLLERLQSVMEKKLPVNDWDSADGDRFVIRRWVQ